MAIVLSAHEARVLGALIEKEATTPEYYPLSVNALANACNQKNNREPVMQLDETDIRRALNRLQDHQLVVAVRDSRVAKYEHRLQEVFNFTRGEAALLCVLLLRGPQTPGELRGRTERMHRFDDLSEVQGALQRLMQRTPPLVKPLARQPGTKETRYRELLSGEGAGEDEAFAASSQGQQRETADEGERLARLEDELAAVRTEVEELRRQFADFRRQFE